jgi:DNA-binding NtrC family response regulator
VRELSHVIERAVLMASGREIAELDFSLPTGEAAPVAAATSHAMPTAESAAAGEDLSLEAMEERLIRRAMERSGGNIQRAADALGVSRQALYRRLEKFGISGT